MTEPTLHKEADVSKRHKQPSGRRNAPPQGGFPQRRWLPWAAVAAVIVAVAAIGLLLARQAGQQQEGSAANGAGSPRLEIDQTRIDFGAVPVNQMVKASFKLRNSGDGTLTFSHPPVPEVLKGC
jgi:hypothetical protein